MEKRPPSRFGDSSRRDSRNTWGGFQTTFPNHELILDALNQTEVLGNFTHGLVAVGFVAEGAAN
jgi:hypothetical protein